MLQDIMRKGLIGGFGVLGLTLAGCRVDAVVYAPPPAVEVQSPDADVVVTDEPPPPPYEEVPPPPYDDAVWIGGEYVFIDGHYVWHHGYYDHRRPGYHRWVRGGWHQGPHGYVHDRGHWE